MFFASDDFAVPTDETAMQDFRELVVWRRAHDVVLLIYGLTADFPNEEQFGLTSQMRRSAASVPSNIAEGCGRGTDADFRRFVQIAMGSASELEYQLLLAADLGLCGGTGHTVVSQELVEVRRVLNGLLEKLTANS